MYTETPLQCSYILLDSKRACRYNLTVVDFDPVKEAKNVRKHGISLRRYDDMTGRIASVDETHADEEDRFVVVGLINGLVYVAGTTWRGEHERIFTLRKATPTERRLYGKATKA